MGIFDSLLGGGPSAGRPGGANDTLTNTNSMPNPFLKAMNQDKVQDLGLIGNGRLGSLLRKHGKVGAESASIIDATLDFFLGGNAAGPGDIPEQLRQYQYTKNFIPIILKTEFNYAGKVNETAKKPLYIVFDSTPENITFSKNANWNARGIMGRPEPIFTYQDSGATTVTITGDFFVDSIQEHIYKLKVSDYLMALASPSRERFMPSPVQVIIGEWKNFRAIVTNVSIDFKGPWKVPNTSPEATQALNKMMEANELSKISPQNPLIASLAKNTMADYYNRTDTPPTPNNNIPQHAPYFFTATLTLSLVSKDNEVKYAEDIIKNAGSLTALSTEDIAGIQAAVIEGQGGAPGNTPDPLVSGAFIVGQSSTGYTFNNGTLTNKTTYTTQSNPDYVYENGDQDRMNGDMAVITNAVSTQLSKFIGKKMAGNTSFIGKLFN